MRTVSNCMTCLRYLVSLGKSMLGFTGMPSRGCDPLLEHGLIDLGPAK